MSWKASTAYLAIQPRAGLHVYFEPQIAGQPQQLLPSGVNVAVSHPGKFIGIIHILEVNGNQAVFQDHEGTRWIMTHGTPEDLPDPFKPSELYSEYWIVRDRDSKGPRSVPSENVRLTGAPQTLAQSSCLNRTEPIVAE